MDTRPAEILHTAPGTDSRVRGDAVPLAVWGPGVAEAPEDRETLILAHIPLVRYVASRMLSNLHASVEYQDLVSYGMFGLIDAIETFKLDAGTKFSTFAMYRIRGAITDEMRDQAWEPRSVRQRSRVLTQSTRDLELKLGRRPTEEELATHVDMALVELRRVESDVRMSRVSSISAPLGDFDGDGTVADMLVSHTDITDLHPQVGRRRSCWPWGSRSWGSRTASSCR